MQIYSYCIGLGVVSKNPNYPAGILYVPSNLEAPITIWEYYPKGRDSSGCSLSYSEAKNYIENKKSFRFMFQQSNAEWFIPFIERMASGENVTIEEIDAKHRELFGKPMDYEIIES